MKKIIVFLLSVYLIAIHHSAFGVTAYPYPVKIIQPDGTKITIILKGDERIKWAETVDGYSILCNSKGVYEYAILDSRNDMIPSGIKVRNQAERSSSDIKYLNRIKKGLTYSRSQVGLIRSISGMYAKSAAKVFPTTGSRKLICILIGFSDKAFTKTKAEVENLFNQVGYNTDGATGSVYDYYKENSYNQLDLTVTVAGPYTAANTMAYYGANDSYGDDIRPRSLVTEAVNLADPDVNYADFDNDGDGTVDGVYVLYAGYGEEAGGGTDAIWAHQWSITPVTLDGKIISRYSCSPELRDNSGTGLTHIGVICHEFGHILGAADYYDTDYATNGSYSGTGNWDIMAGGTWNNNGATPADHNPYTKIYSYGWVTATTLTSVTNINITLNDAEQNSNSFYRINTVTTNEFFLIENRQQYKFDTYIPGHGMIVYHVDGNYISSAGNQINAGSHQGMYPVCANAAGNPPTTYGTINSGALPFPGTSNVTSYTDNTTPNSLSWGGEFTNKPITNITEDDVSKIVSFNFVTNPTAASAITLPASEVFPTSATLNAQVSANNSSTAVSFEYGTTTSYGTAINGTPGIITGDTLTNAIAALTGLTANTTYNYRVKTVNSIGTTYGSNVTFNTVLLNLPVRENFATADFPTGWTTQNLGTGITERWSMSSSSIAGGSPYELKCSYQSYGPWPGSTTRFVSPAIYTVGESGLILSFKHFFDAYGPNATLRIQSSTDKVTWTNEDWSLASSSNSGPETIRTTITHNLNSPNTFIAFVVEGDLVDFDYWYIDDISITSGKPVVTTGTVSTVSSTAVSCGGNVTDDGGFDVTQKGVCWNTEANPTISLDTKTSDGTGVGVFTSSITGLTTGTTYYIRAYATNSVGTSYGAEMQFSLGTVIAPTLTTAEVMDITQTTATSGGIINFDGGSEITAKGVCWSTEANPTIELSTKTSDGTGVGTFSSSISDLTSETTYYIRAYASNSAGTGYGEEVIFTTSSTTYIMNNDPVTTCFGIFTDSGGETGDYSNYENYTKVFTPGTSGNKMSFNFSYFNTESNYDYLYIYDGPDISSPQVTGSPFTGIQTIGIITASAENTSGAITFRFTSDVSITRTGWAASVSCVAYSPSITTSPITSISSTTATTGGSITSDNGAPVTERGVCWSTTADPTVELGTKTSDGTGVGSFISTITGLTPETTYHVRAYATNSAGTGYGSDIRFSLGTVVIPTPTTVEVIDITQTTATGGGIIIFDGGSEITARGVCWSTEVNPTIELSTKTSDGTGVGTFSSSISGLTPGTTYYIRAYASNSAGTGYGEEVVFTTSSTTYIMNNDPVTTCSGVFTDSGDETGDYSSNEDFTKVFTPGISGNKMSFNFTYFSTESSYDYLYIYDGPDISSPQVTGSPFTGIQTIGIITASAENTSGAITFRFHSDYSVTTTGWYATVSCVEVEANPPGITTNPITLISSTTATTGGNITSENGAPVTARGVCWSTTADPTVELNTKTSDGTGAGAFTSSITGLAPETTYHVRAYATNSAGTGYGSDYLFATLPDPPSIPVATSAINIVQTSFTANWSNSETATGYLLDVSTTSAFATFLSGYNNKDIGNQLSASVTGLTAKTTYYYRIRSYNTGGESGNSNIITVTTLTDPPASPRGLTASSCNNLVTLSWRKNDDPYFSHYRIYSDLTNNPTTLIDSTTNNISDTLKILSGLSNGQTYYFRVSAVNYDGPESLFSKEVTTNVKTGVIPKIKVKWGDVLICFNLGDSITSYQWYKDGSIISQATNQYFVTNKISGVYVVKITDKDGCINSSEEVSTLLTKSLEVYPNPASVNFELKIDGETDGQAIISIMNSVGLKILEFSVDNFTNGIIKKDIPVGNLRKGIYLVRVLINNEDLYYTKIVVAN